MTDQDPLNAAEGRRLLQRLLTLQNSGDDTAKWHEILNNADAAALIVALGYSVAIFITVLATIFPDEDERAGILREQFLKLESM